MVVTLALRSCVDVVLVCGLFKAAFARQKWRIMRILVVLFSDDALGNRMRGQVVRPGRRTLILGLALSGLHEDCTFLPCLLS